MSARIESVQVSGRVHGLPCDLRIVHGESWTEISDAMACYLGCALDTIEGVAESLKLDRNGGAAWGASYMIRIAQQCLVELDRLAAERAEVQS